MIHVLGLTEAVLCLLIVSTMHAIIKTSKQQRLDQEEEKNGEAKNDDVNSGVGIPLNSFLVECRIANTIVGYGRTVFHTGTLYDVEHCQNGSAL
jgi:hypothetical protein